MIIKKRIEWFSDLLQNSGRSKWSERLKKWTKYSNITENTKNNRLRIKDYLSIRAVAEIVNKSKSVDHGILKIYNDYGSYEARKSTGRPRKMTKREDHAMVKLVKKNRFKTAAAFIRENLYLGSLCFRPSAWAPVVKSLISSKNKKCRLAFANEHVLWSQKYNKRCISVMNLSFC